jgi:hypothetical protein
MAYMRGDYYLWTDSGEDDGRLHIWVREGYDYWDISGWACREGPDESPTRGKDFENASGTCIPMRIIDDFVMMRLAQLIYEGRVEDVIDRALPNARWSGNIGGRLLRKDVNTRRMKAALREVTFEEPEPS